MFEHSIRVPRHFKIAANIVKKVSEEGGSVKTLLYDNKLKHFRTSVLYALINETIKHAATIEKLFENTGILVNEPRLDIWLAKVLTAELLYGKKTLPGKSKPEQTILSYRERFEKFTSELQDDEKSKVVRRPRYVRINTNLLTTSDAIRAFQDEGYKFIRCTSGSYNDYLEQIQNLTEYDFTQDYHIKTIFVFSPGTKMHDYDLYLENKIILQDKATALAVHLLAPPAGSVVLDMCAAPGMKTTQIAAYLRNQGKIYAVERNEQRYETLCQYVEATGSKCVETLHKDSLEIRRGDLDDVEYILLDPSCSGSGMELSVHNYIEEARLAKLTSLQEKFLKHAMNAFPNAKRIVYSTCSVFTEENERVVTNIVKASRAKWRVKDVKELLKDQWNNFGSGMYGSIGTRCLYAKPDSDFTTGFFLAVLDRDIRENNKPQEDETKILKDGVTSNQELKEKINNCQKNLNDVSIENENLQDENISDSNKTHEDKYKDENSKIKKQKSKTKEKIRNENIEETFTDVLIDGAENIVKKHKIQHKKQDLYHLELQSTLQDLPKTISNTSKKNKPHNNGDYLLTFETNTNNEENDKGVPKKKKKKHKFHEESIEQPNAMSSVFQVDIESKQQIKAFNPLLNLESNVNIESEKEISKKKKKKHKFNEKNVNEPNLTSSEILKAASQNMRQSKECSPLLILENHINDEESEKQGLKKKKKRKIHEEHIEKIVSKSFEVDTENKKQSKECSPLLILENNVNIEESEKHIPKKKKKKHKHREESIEELIEKSSEVLIVDTENINKSKESTPLYETKTKSKTKKEHINFYNSEQELLQDTKNKKKKHKSVQNLETQENIELSENNDVTEQSAIKKKKKHGICEEESEQGIENVLTESNQEGNRKSKKKDKQNNSNVSSTCDVTEQSLVNAATEIRDKKRKKKNKDISEISEINQSDEICSKKKKKKLDTTVS